MGTTTITVLPRLLVVMEADIARLRLVVTAIVPRPVQEVLTAAVVLAAARDHVLADHVLTVAVLVLMAAALVPAEAPVPDSVPADNVLTAALMAVLVPAEAPVPDSVLAEALTADNVPAEGLVLAEAAGREVPETKASVLNPAETADARNLIAISRHVQARILMHT